MVWPPKRTLTESEREHYVEPPIILPLKFWQRKVTGKNKKSILTTVILTHNRGAIHTSVNWSKWDMGEIFGLKFQLLYLHTFKPWINTKYNLIHSYEVDIWSIGCILFTLLVGKPPFETQTLKETYKRIRANEYHVPSRIGLQAKNLIRQLLQVCSHKNPVLVHILKYELIM